MTGPAPVARPVEEMSGVDARRFEDEVASAYRPVVLRGLVADWPLVEAGRRGAGEAAAYLERFDAGSPAKAMWGPPDIKGRFFYDEQMRGYNFKVEQARLSAIMRELLHLAGTPSPPALYAGSAPTAVHLPGFAEANPLPVPAPGAEARIWVGNATRVSTHYDVSDNIAAVALGRRRFTLFPPEQTPNLYVGPLENTMAGQPVSMVDPAAPDLTRYPRFAKAMQAALVAELEPGDALYIPTLWWHQVEALEQVNILVNFWYNAPAASPFAALIHALLAVRDLPPEHRDAWRVWFDHLVFAEEAADASAHLPLHARGITGPPSPPRTAAIRAHLVKVLSGRS